MAGIDSYTSRMLHFDSGDGSTVFNDDSPYYATITPYGGVYQSAGDKVFGTSSAYFDGIDDYLGTAVSDELDFGLGDFTIDFRMKYIDTANNFPGVMSNGYTSFQSGCVWIHADAVNDSKITFGIRSGSTTYSIAGSFTKSSWTHVAIVRSVGQIKLYINGSSTGTPFTFSGAVNLGVNGLNIGKSSWDSTNGFYKGYLDELRISKGIARWTSNFTPRTSAYSPEYITPPAASVAATGSAEFQLNIIECDPAVTQLSAACLLEISIEEAVGEVSSANTEDAIDCEKYIVSVRALITCSGAQTDQYLDIVGALPATTVASGYARTERSVNTTAGVVELTGNPTSWEKSVNAPNINAVTLTGAAGPVIGDITLWLDAQAVLSAYSYVNRVSVRFPAIYPAIAGDFMSAHTYIYNYALQLFADGTTDLSTNQFKAALMRSTYTPDVDAEEFWSDVYNHEIPASGCYDSGGKFVDSIEIVRDDAINTVSVTFGTLKWPVDAGEELRDIKGALIYNASFTQLPLVAFFEFGTAVYVGQENTFVVSPVITVKSGGS